MSTWLFLIFQFTPLYRRNHYEDGRSIKRYENKHNLIEKIYEEEEIQQYIYPAFICTENFFSSDIQYNTYAYVYKTSYLKKFQNVIDNNIAIGEDIACTIPAVFSAKSIGIIKKTGYHYRMRSTSMTHIHDEKSMERVHLLYDHLSSWLNESRIDDGYKYEIQRKIRQVIYFCMMCTAADNLIDRSADFAFPYSMVKNGSKIFVYGLGTYGQEMIRAIDNSERFILAGCSDQAVKEDGYIIGNYNHRYPELIPQHICNIDFDYLIIAVTRKMQENQIKDELIKVSVRNEKIATIDSKLLNESPF